MGNWIGAKCTCSYVVNDTLDKGIKALAAHRDCSASLIVRQAVAEYLNKYTVRKPRKVKQK